MNATVNEIATPKVAAICINPPSGPDKEVGHISETKRGLTVTYPPIHIPIVNLPIMSANILKIIVKDVAKISTIDMMIIESLLPLATSGDIIKVPGIAPSGISPETRELKRFSLEITNSSLSTYC